MKIAVGLSGGVDSAVTAALLKKQGHEVIGVFMKNWSDNFGIDGECPWEQDQRDAEAVAKHLGIEFLSYNFELQYRDNVIKYFFDEYKKGRTPNPDILCNSEIKFNVFLKKCLQELNVDMIATGHYARVNADDESESVIRNQNFHLLKGIDTNKDQSYFLCRLTQEELSRSLFPIGHLKKPEVRKIAEELNLPVAKKKDSQGICFVGKINVRKFLQDELGMKDGEFIDIDTGKVVGKHQGLWFYTIGQREGLGLAGGPWFVVSKDISKNAVYIAKGAENKALLRDRVEIEDIQLLNPALLQENLNNLEVSLRYRQIPAKAKLQLDEKTGVLTFNELQRAVAPGQFACIYVGEELVGSGVITT
jgi:tRNA-specific 2-thiouridylase